jgi:hypothetical protein
MRKSTTLAFAAASIALGVSGTALADGSFGKGGQMVLSAERIFGVNITSTTTEDSAGTGKTTDTRTNLALFWPPLAAIPSPYSIPHLAFDYIIPGGFSIGGSIGFNSSSGTTKTEPTGGMSTEHDDASVTVLAFAPRAGYAMPLAPFVAFWPRAGITYYSIKTETTSTGAAPTTTTTTLSGIGLNLEPMFVLSPTDHFGIVGGPVIDIPLSGTTSTERTPQVGAASADNKVKFMDYGITVGVLGYF